MSESKGLTFAEAADELGLPEAWLRHNLHRGLAHHKYGQHVRFTPADIRAITAEFAKNPPPTTADNVAELKPLGRRGPRNRWLSA